MFSDRVRCSAALSPRPAPVCGTCPATLALGLAPPERRVKSSMQATLLLDRRSDLMMPRRRGGGSPSASSPPGKSAFPLGLTFSVEVSSFFSLLMLFLKKRRLDAQLGERKREAISAHRVGQQGHTALTYCGGERFYLRKIVPPGEALRKTF